MSTSKRIWPETVGMDAEEAVKVIKQSFTGNVITCGPNMACTMELNMRRVIVYVDENSRVSHAPKIG